jgi:glyoxylase-like metal-dependent hydrolase (beta-lactamase superfamily II)
MNFRKIAENHYYFHGAVNIGYFHHQDKGLLIDAGLDAQAMKKVVKQLDEHQLPLTHLFITHAHADHYGGAAYLQKIKEVYTFAPNIEEAILRYPILEPLYLFQGNIPIDELRNKFLEGEPVVVDEVVKEGSYVIDGMDLEFIALPGHSANQFGIKINNIFFAADSYFGQDSLHKHKIPFIIDLEDTLSSLEKLKSVTCIGAVPGHGVYEENYLHTVNQNIDYHQKVLHTMRVHISEYAEGCSHEELVRIMCKTWDVELRSISSWTLYRTAVTAYLTKLYKDQSVSLIIKNHTLWIQQKKEGEA